MSPSLCLKVEGQQCVNIPVQQCSNVPVTGPVEVPQERCYKRPRRVCQTLVSTKPKVVTAKVPKEVCDHSAPHKSSKPKLSGAAIRPSQKIPTQKTSESGRVEHIRSPSLPMSDSMNPHNKLEDLYTAEYQIDGGYGFRGDQGTVEGPELREDMMIAESDNRQHFYTDH